MEVTPDSQSDTTNNPTVQAPFKPRRKIPFIPILGVSITAVVAIGIVVGLMWQSNVFIAKNQDVRSEASGASVKVKALDTINLGISDATTPLDPLFSYYDDLSNRTYVVWSGGAKSLNGWADFPANYNTSAMHVFIKYYDHATKTWSASKKVFEPKHKELYGDGHYAQGVVVDNNGYIHVFQSYHISLRPDESTEEVGIRHATSLRAGSIDSWTTAQDVEDSSGSINTDWNTHGIYFKSRAGNIYGLYRKSPGGMETQTMFKFRPAATPSNGNNGIEPGSLTVKDVIVPDKKTTTQPVLSWNGTDKKVVPQTMTMEWADAYATGYRYDPERDGFHLVFTLRGARTYTQKYYYVFYSFQNDRFYGPNGVDMGGDIVPTKFGTLNTCCVIHDYGTPRDFNALAGRPVIMLDEDQYPSFYLDTVDVQANETSKTIQEINFNPVANKWEAKKLTSLGFTHRVQDAVYVNPDNKYLITLSVAGDPGMGGSHVYHWNGSSWSKKQDIIETLFYPKKQTRSFRYAENFRRDLSGFFINVDDSVFALPAWTIWGYYEGPIKSKLFGFRLNELLQSPVYNGNFEKNSFLGWPRRDDLDPINTSIVDCAKWGVSCPQGKYHLKLVAKNDNKGDYVPYLASDNMDMRENLTEKSIKITFKAKVHTGSAQYSGVWLQRARNLASANPWQDTASAIQPITLTTQWQTFSQIVQLPKSGNNSTTTKVRIVLNPIDKPFDNPVYFDDFQLEYLGEIAPPTSTPTPPNCPGVEITNIAGVCSGSGYQASVSWNAVAGATEYYVAYDDDTQFWGDNPEIGEPVSGANTTQTSRNITFTTDKTRYFKVRITKSNTCTPQDWLYGSTKTITAPVCLYGDPAPITVRAKGTQNNGDGVWPKLELHIKNAAGVYQLATSFTINSTAYKDFTYTHTTPFTASQVRLKLVNGDGPRDVYVDYIKVGNTTYQTEAPTTYSTGTWSSVTKVCTPGYPQSEGLHCNGYFDYLSTTTPPNQPPTASFTEYPGVEVSQGNTARMKVNCADVNSDLTSCYMLRRQRPVGESWGGWSAKIKEKTSTAGTNSLTSDLQEWTCYSNQIGMGHEWVVEGIDKSGKKCTGKETKPNGWVDCGGSDRVVFTCTPPADTSNPGESSDLVSNRRVTIRAKGVKSGNVWPKLELHIKNASGTYQLAKTFTINAQDYRGFSYLHSSPFNASQVRLKFVNDAGARDLYVDYIKFGKAIYQTEAATTYSTGTWVSSTGACTPGYHSSQALHCNGYFDFFK